MGRIMEYLIQASRGTEGAPRYVQMDVRGPHHIALSPFFLLAAILRMAWSAFKGDLALVHLNVAERGSLLRKGVVLLVARLMCVPVVLHLHAAQLVASYEALPKPLKLLVRVMFRSADCCVVLGEVWRRFLIDEFQVPSGKVVVLYNGVPRAATTRIPGAASQTHILFLGNLSERKGVSDLLEALACDPLSGLSWRATLAGGGPVEEYRARAARLGLLSRVTFTGWVSQRTAAALVADADMLVLPSYDEGLPLVILEALTAGVPVVCSPVGAIPEVLEDGRTALFVPPGRPRLLAEALARLVRDPELQERLSRQGQALYEREFAVEVFAERMIGIYRQYCGFVSRRATPRP